MSVIDFSSSHYQRKENHQKKRINYYLLFNTEGTIHLLLKGDILTCYEQGKTRTEARTEAGIQNTEVRIQNSEVG